MIAGLLRGQRRDGGFGGHPYSKWTGAHWRLVSLVELGVAATDAKARAAANSVLEWLAAPSVPNVVAGKERRHASMEGNAVAACSRLGLARRKEVRHLVDVLLRAQWPDGGWNCDISPTARRSSFHESLAPIWGLVEYHRATGDRQALDAAQHAGELLLSHNLYRSSTGATIHPEWERIHWPHYWHYDFFNGLRVLALLKPLDDPRASDAIALLQSRRRSDGSWRAGGHRYWRKPGAASQAEAVDWGDAHEIVTPAALAILR
jgi:hypothetical protein